MAGVYISWPFCAQKCSFCNFASGVFPRELEQAYLPALLAEIREHEWKWTPKTLYLGGGTPSNMPVTVLRDLLEAVPGFPWREATIEAVPGTLTPEKLDGWLAAGINRVSLGVQSFVGAELARTGRRHSCDIVSRDVELLRSHGLTNINIDLIAGLPAQTAESWADSLRWIELLQPPHVSVYLFEVDEDSRLGSEVLAGGSRYGAPDVPNADLAAELYEIAVDKLAAAGLLRYEISNFARPGSESLHNLKYWRFEPYAGFGADAHSFDGRVRTGNVESAADYVRLWQANQPRTCSVDVANLGEERFFVGLRLTEGIELDEAARQNFAEPIERFEAAGLLERVGNRLRLSSLGVLLSNEVLQEFIRL